MVRTSSIMRVVMSSSPDCGDNFLIFHTTYDSCSVIIEVWLLENLGDDDIALGLHHTSKCGPSAMSRRLQDLLVH